MSDARRRWAARGLVAMLAVATTLGVAAAPAEALVPDGHGFALSIGGVVVPANSWPAGTSVLNVGVGRYRVTFPGQAAPRGVVHVTAVSGIPRFCQADAWGISGANEIVLVSCYQPGGVLAASGFTVQFSASTLPAPAAAGQIAYVDANPSAAIISTFNSNAGVNTVAHVGTGIYLVRFGNIPTGVLSGGWQATAVSPNVAARCKIARFGNSGTDQLAYVFCFNGVGAAFDTRFTATFQNGRSLWGPSFPPYRFGYVWWAPGLGSAQTNFNSQLGFGANTVVSAGPGLWLTTLPQLAQPPANVQVTAYGSTSDFCGLNTYWTLIGTTVAVRDVNCFNNIGAPSTSAGYLLSYNSQF